jgi:hypothetical protein
MILQGDVDSGAEEWFCPSCGRRMLMQWTPRFDTLLREHGDDDDAHFRRKAGLRRNDGVVAPELASTVTGSETRWLHGIGINWNGPSA